MLLAVLSVALAVHMDPEARTLTTDATLELMPEAPLVFDVPRGIWVITANLERVAGITRQERARLLEVRATLHFLWEEYERAAMDYSAVARATSGGHPAAEALIHLSRELDGRGKDTLERLSSLAEKHPRSGRIQFCLGVAHCERGKGGAVAARKHLTEALALEPGLSLAYYYRGLTAVHLHEWSDAANDFRRYLESPVLYPPRKTLAHGYYGMSLARLREFRASLYHLTLARQGRPEYWPDVSTALLTAHLKLGNFSTAALLMTQENRKAPKSHAVRVRLFESLTLAGKFDDAIECGLEATRLFPEDSTITARIAVVYCLAGRHRDAAELCEKRLKEDPKCRSTLAFRAGLLAACPDEALRNAPRAADLADTLARDIGDAAPAAAWASALARAANGDYASATGTLHRLLRARGVEPVLALQAKEALSRFSKKQPYRLTYRLGDLRWATMLTIDARTHPR